MRMCRNSADASDLIQDALERCLVNFDRLTPGSNERAWAVTVMHNLFIDRCRKNKREGKRVELDDDPAALVAPEPASESAPAWDKLSADDLRQAVDQLEPEFRDVYRMKALEQRSYKEISSDLGIPMATVGTRLLRARNKLRQLLDPKLKDAKEGAAAERVGRKS
jgi:RNA polymerase sigma-70 factor (ECF subfamily)